MPWRWPGAPFKLSVRGVLRNLADFFAKDGRAWPAIDTLAEECGTSKTTVKLALKAGVRAGIIKRSPRFRGQGLGTNVYEVNLGLAREWGENWRAWRRERHQLRGMETDSTPMGESHGDGIRPYAPSHRDGIRPPMGAESTSTQGRNPPPISSKEVLHVNPSSSLLADASAEQRAYLDALFDTRSWLPTLVTILDVEASA